MGQRMQKGPLAGGTEATAETSTYELSDKLQL